MNQIYIPTGYTPLLDAYDTQRAIAYIKMTFQDEFANALNLKRVSAPLFVTADSGLNDNLNGLSALFLLMCRQWATMPRWYIPWQSGSDWL